MSLLKAMFLIGGVAFVLILVGTRLLSRWPDDQVHLIFCDVGQGDSILLIYRYTEILIDSGPDQSVTDCLARHFPPGDNNIEMVIATHPDSDHIGGFPAVFRQYTVSNLFLIGVGKSTRDFSEFREAVIELLSRGTRVYLGHAGQYVELPGKLKLTIIAPREEIGTLQLFTGQITETQLSDTFRLQEAKYKSVNDLSIGAFLEVGRFKTLLMADIEKETELALVAHRVLSRVNILKVGHHGSKSSTTPPFLNLTRPEYVVISAGKNNRYGHPHLEVMDRLAIIRSKIYRTDRDGDIEWVSNGSTFQWRTQRKK